MTCTYLLTCLLIRSPMLVTNCLLQLLVSFFMEGKCSAACVAWCAEACHQLSNLIFRKVQREREKNLLEKLVEKFRKKSGKRMSICVVKSWRFGFLKLRITHVLQPLILIGKDMVKDSVRISRILVVVLNREYFRSRVLTVYSLSRSFRITVNCSYDMEQGHEDTMMESHPGGCVTACSVRCSILEYLMEMMVIFISPLGSVSLGGFPVQVPYDISPCPDKLTIGYYFLGLKSLEINHRGTSTVSFPDIYDWGFHRHTSPPHHHKHARF
ncbi:hypothetical protein IGI04_015442 [Brassica rapa subsp. trilocularis]|uniref:Uncharacterized protein n=1 Tax=Brassica rapa subsp. trilocularis TaxID=1813537 RepID=A0ABQ7MQK9_BRACM|nr:hypothetical protein IGI04_015442 [Brassica rapa subsp. trilocularis]